MLCLIRLLLIPRGIWPSDVDDQLFSGFSYTINFASYIGIDSELELFPTVDDVFLQPDPTMTLLSTAQSLDDLKLTEQIKFSLERDRFEMAEAVATDVVQSVKERFDDFLRLICIRNGRITTPLLKSKGYPQKVRPNHYSGAARGMTLRSFLGQKDRYSIAYIAQIQEWIDNGIIV